MLTCYALQEWQKKLSQLKVAHLPWDPAPVKEQPLPSNVKLPPQTLPSNGNSLNTPPSSHSTPGSQMKHEQAQYSQQQMPAAYQVPQYPPIHASADARARAAANLQQQYGPRAGQQIAQLQSSGQGRLPPMPQPTSQHMQSQGGHIKQEDQKPNMANLQDYQADMSQGSGPPLKSSQTDGASDAYEKWTLEAASRRELALRQRGEADHLMRAHVLHGQQQLEGGGLMLPLDERRSISRCMKRMVNGTRDPQPSQTLSRAQGDAAADDEDADEDAINSDLDDPDDPAADDDRNEETDQVMLCTYDKVQRVKNKWKCVLKDGILRVDGNE